MKERDLDEYLLSHPEGAIGEIGLQEVGLIKLAVRPDGHSCSSLH